MASLYRRLLGDDFDRLPPALRNFHDVGPLLGMLVRYEGLVVPDPSAGD